jgi:hypothetical protein
MNKSQTGGIEIRTTGVFIADFRRELGPRDELANLRLFHS